MKHDAALEAPHRFSKMPANIIEQHLGSPWRQSGASCTGSYPARFRSGWLSYRLPFRPLAFPFPRLGSRMEAFPFPAKIMPVDAIQLSNVGGTVVVLPRPNVGHGPKRTTSRRRLTRKSRPTMIKVMECRLALVTLGGLMNMTIHQRNRHHRFGGFSDSRRSNAAACPLGG
jgi:hypothetical protein